MVALLSIFYSLFILFSPVKKLENPLIDSRLAPYYKDLHEYLSGKVSQEYIDKYENIKFSVIPLAEEKEFFKNLFVKGTSESYYSAFIGLCIHNYNMIVIRESSLINESPEYIQEMIDHEVGHCVFRRIHRESTLVFNGKKIPKSVMTAVITKGYKDLKIKELYRTELINPSKFNEMDIIEKLSNKLVNLDKDLKELLIYDKELELDLKEDSI